MQCYVFFKLQYFTMYINILTSSYSQIKVTVTVHFLHIIMYTGSLFYNFVIFNTFGSYIIYSDWSVDASWIMMSKKVSLFLCCLIYCQITEYKRVFNAEPKKFHIYTFRKTMIQELLRR